MSCEIICDDCGFRDYTSGLEEAEKIVEEPSGADLINDDDIDMTEPYSQFMEYYRDYELN